MDDAGSPAPGPRILAAEPIRALVFDRDGVLSYFDGETAAAFFRDLVPISVTEVAGLWFNYGRERGFPRSDAEERLQLREFWAFVSDSYQLAAWQRRTLEQVDYADYLVAYPEVKEVLTRLRSMGLRVGVLSNFGLASLSRSLAALELAELIDVAHAAPVTGVAKPEAWAFLAVAQALDTPPQNCLFLDDEQQHVDGAVKAGLRACRVDRSQPLSDVNAGFVNGLTPVLDILQPWPGG